MNVLVPVLAGFFGLLFGSFLNVCIYRIPRDLSVVAPRSFCPECTHPLSWYENIPVASFLLLGGRCRHCRKSIRVRYLLVEFMTAVLFALVVAVYGISAAALKWSAFEALLIVLFFTDWEERILPDEVIAWGAASALVSLFAVPLAGAFGELLGGSGATFWRSLVNAVLGAALLALPVWLLGALWSRARKREALGFGDVKLLAMLGLFLGPEQGLLAISIGTVAGAVYGLAGVVLLRKSAGSYELPFGSFLCLGAALGPFVLRFPQHPLAVL